MYIPIRLEIINLLSHTKTVFEFEEGVAFMVMGENLDDDGQESNGAGKSGLIEGVSIAITGKPFRKVKDMDLIHYGEDEAVIKFLMENKIRGESFEIVRTLYSGKNKSSTLECFIDGVIQSSAFPTVPEGNKWILQKIGLSREDIINYFVVSKSKSVSFFGQSDTAKKEIVARFSGTDSLLPLKDEIMGEIKDFDGRKGSMEGKLLGLEGKRDAYQEQLAISSTDDQKKLKENRITDRELRIEKGKEKIASTEKEIETTSDRKKKAEEALAIATKEQSGFVEIDYTKELGIEKTKETKNSTEIGLINTNLTVIVDGLREFRTFKAEIEQNLADSIECPSCKHNFILRDKSYNLEEAKAQLPIIIEEINTLEKDKEKLDIDIQKLRNLQGEISTKMEGIRKKSREQADKKALLENTIRTKTTSLNSEKEQLTVLESRVIDYNKLMDELKEEIKNIKLEKVVDPSIGINKLIKENEEAIVELTTSLDTLKDEWVEAKEFEATFIRFITHLSNKAVKSIEIRTNEYLKNMGSNLSIEIEGYKVNADNSIREKFTTVVSRDGIPEAFIEGYSEGEQARINIATTLALNSLLNMSCKHGEGLGFVILDELMGSLDPLGVGLTMESLNSLNQTILAISHVEPRNYYPHSITIVKENGYSFIK